ncbi:MAG: ribosomal protein S18-alanine N-acetyltransferase [Desulfobulbaceae bacterium]|nr:ribosomal protein S18-alanine N-acetyltransferase [Desulfobulbaceae bacterium]
MTEADLPDVVRGEYEKPAWTRAQFEGELHHPQGWQFIAHSRKTGQFAGYLCGRSVADESEIIKIAVVPDCRRQGVARQLLQAAVRHMQCSGVTRCFLEVRQSNVAARKLYEKNLFHQSGVRRKYYSEPLEDALIFKLDLVEEKVEKEQE